MMQIGGIDNLVLKDVKLPAQNDQEEKKIVQQQEDASKAAQEAAAKKEKDAERTEKTEESVYGDLVFDTKS